MKTIVLVGCLLLLFSCNQTNKQAEQKLNKNVLHTNSTTFNDAEKNIEIAKNETSVIKPSIISSKLLNNNTFIDTKKNPVYNNNAVKKTTIELPSDFEDEIAKREYWKERYLAAPGTNIDSIRESNLNRNRLLKQEKINTSRNGLSTSAETFAGGLLEGNWHERGPINEAGDLRAVTYDVTTNNIYAISTSGYNGTTGRVGHLWKGNLDGITPWVSMNDDIHLETNFLELIPIGTSVRLFANYNNTLRYSDNEGASWNTSSGIYTDYTVTGRKLFTLSDNNTIYYLIGTWRGAPWGYGSILYKSNDKGVTFTQIWANTIADYNYNGRDVDMWKPENSDDFYLVDNRRQLYYKFSNTLNAVPNISSPIDFSTSGVTKGNIYLTGRYNSTISNDELFIAENTSAHKIFKATNGIPFSLQGASIGGMFEKAFMADPDNSNLYLGGFQMQISNNNGLNWAEKYSQWWEYYKVNKPGHLDSMHVDIMDMKYFKKIDGTPLIIILNHAGIYVTYDNMATTKNLGLNNLNCVTLYDQTTASDGFMYFGAQDKGNFRYQNNANANFNTIVSNNFATGDGMGGLFYNNDQSLFFMSPSGLAAFPNRNDNSTTAYSGLPQGSSYSFSIPGSNILYWERALKGTPDLTDSKCLIGGGNLLGGTGSRLIFVDFNNTTNTFSNTQTAYDFRTNSRSGTGVISAIGTAVSDANRLYVATNDGIFFSSLDYGVNWTKQTSIMPSTFRPWDIITSNSDANKVFICGTGFSNSGVYRSIDGGVNFTAINNGLPLATVFEIALAANEQYLFAATSAGPYVYVFASNTWYPLLGSNTPLAVDFSSVDIVNQGSLRTTTASNPIVRFGTYGRGVWDFEITNTIIALPISIISFVGSTQNNSNILKWKFEISNFSNYSIEKSNNGTNFIELKNYSIANNSSLVENSLNDYNVEEISFYRLKFKNIDGSFTYSNIIKLASNRNLPFTVYPNPATDVVTITGGLQNSKVYIYSSNGKLIEVINKSDNSIIKNISNYKSGLYLFKNYNNKGELKTVKVQKK